MPSFTQHWMNMTGATDATPNIPGDGVGSRLERVTAAKNITAIVSADPARVTLNSVAALVVGQLVITTDGFWGTIIALPAATTDIVVDRWRHASARQGANPATGVANLNVFPAGSILAGMQSGRILRITPTKSVTGVSANYLLDYRMSTSTPIMPYASVVGQLMPAEFGGRISSPFACQIGTVANFDCTVVFELSS